MQFTTLPGTGISVSRLCLGTMTFGSPVAEPEGLSNLKPGDPVAMVEDVVTTGGSLLKACERVKDAGLNVVAVCTVLDRGEGGREAIEAAGYQLRALFTRPELVELAKED